MSAPRPIAIVAEGDPLLRLDAADMLDALGFDVLEACHAREAMQHLEDRDGVALLYTDIRMPGSMCGRQLAHLCAERWPETRIIVCSSCHRSEAAQLPQTAHFIPKPCAEKLVRSALKALRFH